MFYLDKVKFTFFGFFLHTKIFYRTEMQFWLTFFFILKVRNITHYYDSHWIHYIASISLFYWSVIHLD